MTAVYQGCGVRSTAATKIQTGASSISGYSVYLDQQEAGPRDAHNPADLAGIPLQYIAQADNLAVRFTECLQDLSQNNRYVREFRARNGGRKCCALCAVCAEADECYKYSYIIHLQYSDFIKKFVKTCF